MHRDINLRTPGSQKGDNKSIRQVDSRVKRPNNNKINIYSQKYTLIQNQIQRQDPKVIKLSDQKASEHLTINLSNSRIKTAIIINRKQDIQSKQHSSQSKSSTQTTSQKQIEEKQDKNTNSSLTLASLKQYIEEMKIFYQSKIKQITEDNARIISQLRNLLVHQQNRIAQKQEIINKILSSDRLKYAANKSPIIRFNTNESPSKIILSKPMNANANQQYLTNKIKDLQAKLRIFMDQFIDSEEEVKSRIESIQNNLIRYFSSRITKCWFRLGQFSQYFEKRFTDFDNQLVEKIKNKSNFGNNKNQAILQKILMENNSKITQISKQIKNFSNNQCKYENQRVQSLQNVLISLMQKLDTIQKKCFLQSSRRIQNGLFFEDEDQFFYPSSQRRVYEPNDQYEHFQSQSQDETSSFIKENINNNCQSFTHLLQKSKKI